MASDLFGVSGRRMLASLVAGRSVGWMVEMARGTLRGKKGQLELACQGTFTDHQRRVLGRLLQQMNGLERQPAELTSEIEQRVAPHEELLRRMMTIPGLDRISAWTVLAEIGTDMSVFGDAAHLASWAALCPGNRESGGKRISGKTRKGNRYIRRVLCQSAWGASHKKDSHLSAFYRRVRNRRGEQKAIMALAHQLLVILFHVIRDGTVYRELGHAHFDQPEPAQPATQVDSDAGASVEAETRQQRKRGRPCKCAERGIACKHRGEINPSKNLGNQGNSNILNP